MTSSDFYSGIPVCSTQCSRTPANVRFVPGLNTMVMITLGALQIRTYSGAEGVEERERERWGREGEEREEERERERDVTFVVFRKTNVRWVRDHGSMGGGGGGGGHL